ncbi:MAG: cation:proton antiporter [Burkholderiaceae bacterium]|nr:cation:proton antiporter [Burkholderiaceae bacterium]
MPWNFSIPFLTQPLTWNALLLFGTLLILGLIGGQLVARINWMPRITGYLLIGFFLGPGGMHLLSGEMAGMMRVFADAAMALMVYQLGRYVDIVWLLRERWLLLTIVFSALLTFLFVWGLLEWTGTTRNTAMLTGVFAIGTSPAIIMAVMGDLRAEGHITRRLAAMSALNNCLALLGAYILLPLVASEKSAPVTTLLSHTAYSVGGSLLVAYLTYLLLMPLARWLGRQRKQQFVLVIAMLAMALGAAYAFHLPVLMTMLAFAILSRNLDHRYDLMELEFGIVGELFVVLMFVSFGAAMEVDHLPALIVPVIMVVLARAAAIGGTSFALARPAKLSWKQAAWFSIGSLPLTESGFGLIQISAIYPDTTADLVPLIVSSLLVLEILGPIATQFALLKSGETGHV